MQDVGASLVNNLVKTITWYGKNDNDRRLASSLLLVKERESRLLVSRAAAPRCRAPRPRPECHHTPEQTVCTSRRGEDVGYFFSLFLCGKQDS